MPDSVVAAPRPRTPVIGYTADGTPIVNPPRAPRHRAAGNVRPVKNNASLGSPVINKRRKRP